MTDDSSVSGVSSISSLGSGSYAPEGNLTALTKIKPKPLPFVNEDNHHVDPDTDGLEFVGAFMADAVDDAATWVASTSDPHNVSLSFGANFTTNEEEMWFDSPEGGIIDSET